MKQKKKVQAYFTRIEGRKPVDSTRHLGKSDEFDPAGNLLSSSEYFPSGEFNTRTTYEYNQFGQLAKEVNWVEENTPGETLHFRYDQAGDLIEIETAYLDGASSYKRYRQTPEFRETLTYEEEGVLDGREVEWLDGNGNVIGEEVYDEDGNLLQKTEYNLDSEGRIVERYLWNEQGEREIFQAHAFDQNGHEIRRQEFDNQGNPAGEIHFTYNEEGNPTLEKGPDYRKVWHYDQVGREVRSEVYDSENGLIHYLISDYGEGGELVSQIQFDQGEEYWLEAGVKGRTLPTQLMIEYENEFY